MKYRVSIIAILMLLSSFSAQAESKKDIVWTSTEVKPGNSLDISSDTGGYQYEALEPEADKTLQPEIIPASRMMGRKPMIAIVIDDMGVDRQHSTRAVKELPPMVSLSYLPYSPELKEQVATARTKGHELILHLPMQPERRTANPGPDYLGASMSPLELHDRLLKNLDSFEGYVAVNNHMGSRFTKDHDGLNVVMAELADRQLMFLDSLTSPGSIAERTARENHILTAHRDVFIDNEEAPAKVAHSLSEIEGVARRTGTAIAIGHPKDVTLSALEKWLPGLTAKGFQLVALSQVIALRNTPRMPAPKTDTIASAPPPAAPVALATPKAIEPPPLEVVTVDAIAEPVASTENPGTGTPPRVEVQKTEPPKPAPAKPVIVAAPPAQKKTYIDSLAKVEAKAKEWEEHKTP